MPSHPKDLPVVALAYDGLCTFEMGIVVEIFGRARPELDRWYDFEMTSIDPPPLRAAGGMSVWAPHGLEPIETAGTIVVPGWRDIDSEPPEELLEALRAAHGRGARLLSICSGVYVLAASGLLDGLRATTHWRYAEHFSRRFPAIALDAGVLYVDEGRILTSAGSAAGIDCCLHLVRRDFGSAVTNVVARRLVAQPHRRGGQAQFIDGVVPEEDSRGLGPLLDAVRARLSEPHTVAGMARLAAVSPRTLARRFERLLGTTPHRWLVEERLRLSRRLLETTDLDVEEISRLAGLGSAQVLRHHFKRRFGTPPSAYRRAFGARQELEESAPAQHGHDHVGA